jgi:hypothetical protein
MAVCALKCFTRPAVGLRERYLKIDEQLRELGFPFRASSSLPEGVRIRGLWFPALKMEWVEGLQLNQFVRENVERRDNLKALLGMWMRLCKRLRDADIAHADLQHGNVLLVPGATANTLKLRLIDYDGMWVPALAKSPSGEAGHPNYHTRGCWRDLHPPIDRFPHLVIGPCVLSLPASRLDRFDNGDNLLFREVDFANPRKSELFRALWELDDPTVTNLVALLIASAQRPMGDTPWLDELLAGTETVPVSDAVLAYAADTLGVPRRAARKAPPVAQIYVVPQEANEFAELGSSARSRRKRKISAMSAVLVGGSIIAVAAIIGIVIAVNGKSATDPINPDSPPTNAQPADKGTTPVAKTGTIETKWAVIPAGQPMPSAKALVSGIDTAPPATKVIRSFNQPGVANLGAWFLPDGMSALVASRGGLGILDLHTKQARPLPRTASPHIRIAVTPDCLRAISVARPKHSLC